MLNIWFSIEVLLNSGTFNDFFSVIFHGDALYNLLIVSMGSHLRIYETFL